MYNIELWINLQATCFQQRADVVHHRRMSVRPFHNVPSVRDRTVIQSFRKTFILHKVLNSDLPSQQGRELQRTLRQHHECPLPALLGSQTRSRAGSEQHGYRRPDDFARDRRTSSWCTSPTIRTSTTEDMLRDHYFFGLQFFWFATDPVYLGFLILCNNGPT